MSEYNHAGQYIGPTRHTNVESYSIADNTWTTRASITTSRYEADAAVLNNELYVCGGENEAGHQASCEKYDVASDSWSAIASMPATRYAHGAAAHGGYLYVVGGRVAGTISATAERYDPSSDLWSPIASMGTARSYCPLVVIDDYIYAPSGYTASGVTTSVERYSPSSDSWEYVASMSCGSSAGHEAVALGGKMYVVSANPAGDSCTQGNALYKTGVQRYDPSTDSWDSVASYNHDRRYMATAVANGRIWIMLGLSYLEQSAGRYPYPDTTESYDPATNTWTSTGYAPHPGPGRAHVRAATLAVTQS